jgi:hypothetical protein
MSDKIDYKRCRTDFEYFCTHCLIDGKTNKLFKWSKKQLEQIKILSKIITHENRIRKEIK